MNISANEVSNKVQQAFDFSVDKFPLSGPDGMRTDWYALFRSDTENTVGNGSVTSRYVPHQTDDVLALVESAAEAFDGEIDVQCHFRDGHYVNIMPTKADRVKVYGERDNVWPRVIINAGYDGKAFRATMGYYRDACRNLAMMRQINGTSVSIRHTSGLRSKMDDLIATFNTLKDSWNTLTDVILDLQNRDVQMVSFLNEIYGEPATDATQRAVTVHRMRTEAIFKRLQSERFRTGRSPIGSDFGVSAWEAYNAVQGYVQHDAQSKQGFKGDFDRILRASRDANVRKAESIVLELVA
jgi:ketosteroid isomerase-like protein